MSKIEKRIVLAMLSVLILVPAAFVVYFKVAAPSPRERLLADLTKYASILDYYFPFVTGIVPELTDAPGGTLPLAANDQFESLTTSEKYDAMEQLTDFIPEEDARTGLSLSPRKRRIYENVIIQSSAGCYQFLEARKLSPFQQE